MNFNRKKRIKGRSAKTYKEWHSDCGQYRITWRSQVCGVDMPPRYFATIRCVRSPLDQTEYWGFAARRGTYKSRKAAIKACELNEKYWKMFLAMEGRDKVAQVRDLKVRSSLGSGTSAYCTMHELPAWVFLQLSPRQINLLPGGNSWPSSTVSPSDPTETSRTSEEASPSSPLPGTSDTHTSGPVSPATDEDGTTTPTTTPTPVKEADTDAIVSAPTAKAPVKGRGKQSSKRTGRKSASTKSKGTSTSKSKGRGRKRSRSSPRKKS